MVCIVNGTGFLVVYSARIHLKTISIALVPSGKLATGR